MISERFEESMAQGVKLEMKIYNSFDPTLQYSIPPVFQFMLWIR
jgi:hypothetical protein